jgi:hypothetical protein
LRAYGISVGGLGGIERKEKESFVRRDRPSSGEIHASAKTRFPRDESQVACFFQDIPMSSSKLDGSDFGWRNEPEF